MKSESVATTQRLAGIEWMRGLAAFGVICIHSGLAVHNRTTTEAGFIRDDFDFVVPFFLTTSFFFAVQAERNGWVSWGNWMKRQGERILVPFVFWSTVYLALHFAKLAVQRQGGEIAGLLADPGGLVLSGGTSVALYFLPLLFMGLALIHLLSKLFREAPVYILAVGLIVSLGLHEACGRLGLVYDGGPVGAGSVPMAPLRLLVGLSEEGIRCAPLVFAVGILHRYLPSPHNRKAGLFLGAGLVLLGPLHAVELPLSLMDPVRGLGGFLVGWGLSGLLAPSKIGTMVGLFSFGVYLIHHVFLEGLQMVFKPGVPIGVTGTLAISAGIYLASMLAVGWASSGPAVVRRVLGLR